MNARASLVASTLFLALTGCGQEAPKADKAPKPSEQPQAETTPEPAAPKGPALKAPADPNEACGQIIVVSYAGATPAMEGVSRDKEAARARAAELLAQAASGAELAQLAKDNSDAPSSAQRGGVMGTFTKDEWPELHAAIKEPLFALQVNELAGAPIEAPYGFVIARRCKVEKAHGRHVLIRFKGAKNAGPEIKRSADDARKLAAEVQQKLSQGADFDSVAKKYSEDASKSRGGDVGLQGRGRLAPAFEESLFALKVGELSTIVETEYGFHVIQRLPDAAPQVAP